MIKAADITHINNILKNNKISTSDDLIVALFKLVESQSKDIDLLKKDLHNMKKDAKLNSEQSKTFAQEINNLKGILRKRQ